MSFGYFFMVLSQNDPILKQTYVASLVTNHLFKKSHIKGIDVPKIFLFLFHEKDFTVVI